MCHVRLCTGHMCTSLVGMECVLDICTYVWDYVYKCEWVHVGVIPGDGGCESRAKIKDLIRADSCKGLT